MLESASGVSRAATTQSVLASVVRSMPPACDAYAWARLARAHTRTRAHTHAHARTHTDLVNVLVLAEVREQVEVELLQVAIGNVIHNLKCFFGETDVEERQSVASVAGECM